MTSRRVQNRGRVGRWALLVLASVGVWTPGAVAEERPTHPFDREWLVEKARELASREHRGRDLDPDDPLSRLDYDQYRAIRFEPGASIWAGEDRSFRVGLLHLGFIYKTPVQINLVVGGVSRRVLYTPEIFEYGLGTERVKAKGTLGYSGFRVGTPINRPDLFDEFLVYQGGSYFRAVGKGNLYGLSARGLALRTAKPAGEEFPLFTEFWIERPRVGAGRITVHALLESPSVTGAYSFRAEPGEPTVIDVEATLFPRTKIGAYGLAPLTSMFLFDATNRARFDDFRPAVHDSDGLLIEMKNGEQVWRPLANPESLEVSAFSAPSIRGFGLMQRHRDFSDFEDIEARYERRPSAWIEPRGDWGPGHVELVEIPTGEEIHDNIVAFWQPGTPLRAGQRQDVAYRMHWGDRAPIEPRGGRIVATRSGRQGSSQVRIFTIDYAADVVPQSLDVAVTTSSGSIVDARGIYVEETGQYRAFFKFDPKGTELAEFRLVLSSQGKPWGETWLYRWTR